MKKCWNAVRCRRLAVAVVATLALLPASLQGQLALGSAISYQGRLMDGGAPATGSYDLRFTLFDAVTGGAQVGSVVTADATTVTAGVFTVSLDFGAGAFAGSARWLEVAVRQGVNPFTILTPRQALLAAPNAMYALNATTATSAATATNAIQLAGRPDSFYLNLANQTGTLSIAQGGTGATSLAGLQTRVTGTCAAGTALQAVNSDGSAVCGAEPWTGTAPVALDHGTGPDEFWDFTSLTIGVDGLGLVSYQDGGNGFLKVAHCTSSACTNAALAILDASLGVGAFTSIAIGADGLGLVSYYDGTNGNLKVAHCQNVGCSGTSAPPATLDSSGDVGSYTSITIGTDGLGLISYYDATNGDLKVAHCANAACSSLSAPSATLDSTGDVGQYTSITIGTDGRGLVSYYDNTNQHLKAAHCADVACSSVSATPATLDSTGNVGVTMSITVGTDGLGLISYYDATNSHLKVAHCTNTACSGATLATVDGAGAGVSSSITIGTDGLGLISYAGTSSFALKVAHCANLACSSATLATIDSGRASNSTSIAIGADGLGLISCSDHANFTGGQVKVAHCGNTSCSATSFAVRRR